MAQGSDERSACPCTQPPTTATYTSLPSLGMLKRGAAKTALMRHLLSFQTLLVRFVRDFIETGSLEEPE